jgi:hypothetical protein
MADIFWHDQIIFHKEQCERQIRVLNFYFDKKSLPSIKNAYKLVMSDIIDNHETYLKKLASDKGYIYDNIDFNWIKNLRVKIQSLHDQQ